MSGFWRGALRALSRSSPAFTGTGRRFDDLDDEDRDQSYARGFADGRLAERAGAGPLPVESGVHSDGEK